MKRTYKVLVALALLTLLLIPAAPALAKGPFDGGPVIFGGNYTLESGDTLNSDLVVFGGNVEIKEDATVKGSIVVFGGNVTMNGTMTGDLVIFGGSGTLQSKAVVKGDFVTVGGSFTRAEGAVVEGEIRNEPAIEIPAPTVPNVPETPAAPKVNFNPFGSAIQAMVMAIVMGALAMLLTLFLHPQMDRVAQTAIQQPLVAGGVGLLTMLLYPFALLLMIVTLILIPVAVLSVLVAVVVWIFGIVSLGMELGDRFTRAMDQSWPPVLASGFGTFLLMLVAGGIGTVPCIGWMAPFLVGSLAVGAVILTFINARNARLAAPIAPATPVPPAAPDDPLPPAS